MSKKCKSISSLLLKLSCSDTHGGGGESWVIVLQIGGSSQSAGNKQGSTEPSYVNNHSYYNLKNQHLVEDNYPPPLPEICVTNDGYSYVDEIHTTTNKSSRSHQSQSSQKTGGGGSKTSSGFYHYYQNHRARRTQPRITQNEKRYHSGQDLYHPGMLYLVKHGCFIIDDHNLLNYCKNIRRIKLIRFN